MSSKYIPGAGFEERSMKDVSPKKEIVSGLGQGGDSVWSKYFAMASE
jgi:hypothetical protein